MENYTKNSIHVFIVLVAFSISGFSQALRFEGVTEVKPLKRGKEYSIKWSGGVKDQNIKIELHNRTGKVQSWDETQNDGEQLIKLNSKLKPGKNYSFKILTSNGDQVSEQNVQVNRRIPLALTISTIIIVPAVVILLSTRNDGVDNIAEPFPPSSLPGN